MSLIQGRSKELIDYDLRKLEERVASLTADVKEFDRKLLRHKAAVFISVMIALLIASLS